MSGTKANNVSISSSELPYGWVALSGGINNQSTKGIEELAKNFDETYVPKWDVVVTTSTWNKANFAGWTFNTNSTGATNKNELFNKWKGKNSDTYED